VQIEEFVFHWVERAPQDIGRLGVPSTGMTLGAGAFLGDFIPDRQYKFRIVLGPLDFEEYLKFTPKGENLLNLVEWVREFFGRELAWELELKIKPETIPMTTLGGAQQLGWSTWIERTASSLPVRGMCFEPEHYMAQLQEWHKNTAASRQAGRETSSSLSLN
jgi:type VI secretion system ImpH/TssG family protein